MERVRGTELGILCSKSFATSLAAAAAVRTRKMFDLSHTQQQPAPSVALDVSSDLLFFRLPFVQEKKEKKKKKKKRALIL